MTSICIKLKTLIIFGVILCFALACAFALPRAMMGSSPNTGISVVIDAGHGGIDGGSVGKTTGVDENNLNLAYAKTLEAILKKYNFGVVMTRTDLGGLYDITSPNKKKSDMKKRKEIILKSKASLVISLHMNSFPRKSSRGAQVFYKKDDVASKTLAESMQEVFIEKLPKAKKAPSTGDYFILNCSSIPSVIVECGFLSNEDEEKLLVTEEYKNAVCDSIFVGILNFLAKN